MDVRKKFSVGFPTTVAVASAAYSRAAMNGPRERTGFGLTSNVACYSFHKEINSMAPCMKLITQTNVTRTELQRIKLKLGKQLWP